MSHKGFQCMVPWRVLGRLICTCIICASELFFFNSVTIIFFSWLHLQIPRKIFDFSLCKDKLIVLTNGAKHSLLWQWFLKWQIWNIGRLMSPPSSHLIFQDFEEETILHRSFFFPQLFSPRKNQCQNRLCMTFSWDVPNAELPCGKYDRM